MIIMTKSNESISEVVRTKHPFRQTESRPAKPQKNRYERRRIREILRLSDWSPDEQMA
jgi:hypothetical protein